MRGTSTFPVSETRPLGVGDGEVPRANFLARMIGGGLGAIVREFRSASTNTGSLANPSAELLNALGAPTRSGAKVSEDTAFNVAVFSACLKVLSQSLAMLPCELMRKTPTGYVPAPDHPLYRLLKSQPSGGQSSYQWRAHKIVTTCLGGNGYSRIWRNPFAEVIAITPLKAVEVTPKIVGEGRADERLVYHWRGAVLQDYDVIHLRGLSSNGYTGRNVLADLRETLGTSLTAQAFTASSFANGNRQPGVISLPPTTSPEKAKEFQKFYAENYAGASNAGKSPVFMGGATWTAAGFTNQDAELLLSRRFEKEEILMWFQIASEVLGGANGTTTWGSGVDKLMRGFVTFTLQPWIVNLEQELESDLLTEAEKAEGYKIRFDVDTLLRGDPLQRAQLYKLLREIRAITVNEIRRKEELNELPDTGANNAEWGFNTAGGAGGQQGAPTNQPAAPQSLVN